MKDDLLKRDIDLIAKRDLEIFLKEDLTVESQRKEILLGDLANGYCYCDVDELSVEKYCRYCFDKV